MKDIAFWPATSRCPLSHSMVKTRNYFEGNIIRLGKVETRWWLFDWSKRCHKESKYLTSNEAGGKICGDISSVTRNCQLPF